MRKNNRKGFTIVELVIVIAVIAILAGVLIPTFATVVSNANESKALQEAQNAIKVMVAEYAEKGMTITSATIYCFKGEAKLDGDVEYTVEYANGVAEKPETATAFTYTEGDCYAATEFEVKANDSATEVDESVDTKEIADLANNIIVVVKATK